ncbi:MULTISPECIES: DUF3566 domain-containing protein [Kocuria]|uniref:DUF3566 domain-containing protein n=1 Tax=Kocuria palustris PEL TaxID=1236550 RepID=M2XW13_9MICC|nr:MULTISPECIES: DUF3566 domain-containing protein [Kocuria]MDN5573960.1 DUF3566 domain-containing protein [Micrococcales bacterium]EME36988.1 hypothetical protein C884_02348 [Kocuria palustris PEL]KUG54680.1 hypothetical protein AVL60_07570 [Kocuria palustris]MCM3330598.1 DUF3566 domain-containing protein [Kocuria palustris]MCY1684797.1 DUF3566 domain-containing protein [Kocuria sp. SL71]
MSPEARSGAAGRSKSGGAGRGSSPSQAKKADSAKASSSSSRTPQRSSTKGLVRPAPRAKVRRARLVVSRVDTWSVLKLAFLLSVSLGIVVVVAAVLIWILMDITGLFNGINELAAMLAGPGGSTEVQEIVSLGQVAIFATILSVINVILLTLLSVIAAMLYNLAAGLIGGIGVTLTDD